MGLEQLALPVELLRSDFIVSMPKLKTHHWAGMTASMKNFFGVVPGAVYGWPKNILHVHGIDNSIVDLNATIRPHLAIVDAVTAMEGDGPIMGNATAVGHDRHRPGSCAVDATCARVIGLDPDRIPYLEEAGKFLGHTQRIPNRSHEASPWPVSPRGSRLSIPSSPAAWTGADRFGTSRSKSRSGADHCVVPARTPLAGIFRVTEVQRICVASVRFRRHLLCGCHCENAGVACTPLMRMLKPGFGHSWHEAVALVQEVAAELGPPQRCLLRLTCTFTSPGVWRSGTRPRQVNTR